MSKSEVLVLMTGSIACYKACHVISRLAQAGHGVQVVASSSALQFVGSATLEGLSGRPVVSDLWEKGRAMDHIHLIRKADLVIAAPASAHFINRIAQGIGDDLLTTLFLAHDFKKPFLVAPAMNTSMYLHPATQGSLAKLKSYGVTILETASGVLACGETGFGKLLEPELLLKEVLDRLAGDPADGTNPSPFPKASPRVEAAPLRVLITAGGTREPVDEVRSLTNTSTGRSGARLAEKLDALGVEVTLLRGAHGVPAAASIEQKMFSSFDDLSRSLEELLSTRAYTHVIHMAAVSDYRVDAVEVDGRAWPPGGKIPSGHEVRLVLKSNPKLIEKLKSWSLNPSLQVIGFKLTSGLTWAEREVAARKVLESARLVVGNDLSEIDDESGRHPYVFYSSDGAVPLTGFEEMSSGIARYLVDKELP